jgi:hypothetical protein
LRAEGLSGGVVSTEVEGRMIVLLHFSQIPSVDVMGRLQVLHIATVVELFLRWCGDRLKSYLGFDALVGTDSVEFGS